MDKYQLRFVTLCGHEAALLLCGNWLITQHLSQSAASLTPLGEKSGLVQLVDLFIGEVVDTRGLTALMWSSRLSSSGEQIRNYFIHKALSRYYEALAMEMPKLIDEIAEKVMVSGQDSGLNWDSDNPKERAKIRRHIEGFEDEYFEGMRETIERRRKQEGW